MSGGAVVEATGKNMRIAVFLADLEGGGAERMMVQLAAGMAVRGHRADLVLARAVGPYVSQVPASVRIVDLRRRSTAAAIPALARYLRMERPDVLLSTLHHASVAAAIAHAATRSAGLLFLREANTVSRLPAASRGLKARAVRWMIRWAYARAVGVLAVSEGVAQDLVSTLGVPAAKVTTVYNPVINEAVTERARVDPEHPWFAPGQPPVVLGVGSLQARKDFGTLIEAFAILRRKRAARLVILGEGPQRAALQRQVDDLGLVGEVDLPGFADNPFGFMSRAAVFVLSSVVEGLPGVLIQAMGCGCPVVATDCPSGPREILDGGRYGELVPVADPVAMSDAIERTLDAAPDRVALIRRSDVFAVDRVVGAHLEVFEGARRTRSGPGSRDQVRLTADGLGEGDRG